MLAADAKCRVLRPSCRAQTAAGVETSLVTSSHAAALSETDQVRTCYVYILTNVSRTLYIGVTNDLERRMAEHRRKMSPGFTRAYNVTLLVHVEPFTSASDAIAREKQLKRWSREKKVRLIESENPAWRDLAADWFESCGETVRADDASMSERCLDSACGLRST
jgi:putative endonuclease